MEHKRKTLKQKLDASMEDMGPFTPLPRAARDLSIICLDEIIDNLDGTIIGEDPEHLHDMRVASRRLRSGLRVFGPCYRRALAETIERARTVTALLGPVRDLDVRMMHLRNIKSLVTERAASASDLLTFSTSMQWEQMRERMVEGLRGLREGDWYKWMSSILTSPSYPRRDRWCPCVHSVPAILANKRAVITNSYLASTEEAINAQHSLRISIKKYRYSLEHLKFCFTEDIEKVLAQCKRLQDDLGLMHDYDILSEYISTSTSRSLPRNIKKGLDELKVTIEELRHRQYLQFQKHVGPFLKMDPSLLRR